MNIWVRLLIPVCIILLFCNEGYPTEYARHPDRVGDVTDLSESSAPWKDFWQVSPIRGTTINFIETPFIGGISFLKCLYVFLLLTAVSLIVLLRPVNRQSVLKAFLLSSLAAGILFALRMDYSWYAQWREDQEFLSKQSLDERIMLLDGNLAYYFAQEIKKRLPADEKVRVFSGDDYFRMKFRYHLLPVRVSDNGNYIVVYRDKIMFNPADNQLIIDEKVVSEHVLFVAAYLNEFFIFKETGAGK
jgi:hypothetical protein